MPIYVTATERLYCIGYKGSDKRPMWELLPDYLFLFPIVFSCVAMQLSDA